MKRILAALLLFTLGIGTSAVRSAEPSPSDTLVWCGLDYSKVKMMGTLDFRRPEEIFPNMLVQWNGLFMKEMLPELQKMAKSIRTDLASTQVRNERAVVGQIERKDGSEEEMVKPSHITDADIAEIVKSIKLEAREGMGLVFVMDRLVKNQAVGCMYVVFFDIPSSKVIRSERVCGRAGGAGFRNYWFKPIKETVRLLPKMYKDAKSKTKNETAPKKS